MQIGTKSRSNIAVIGAAVAKGTEKDLGAAIEEDSWFHHSTGL